MNVLDRERCRALREGVWEGAPLNGSRSCLDEGSSLYNLDADQPTNKGNNPSLLLLSLHAKKASSAGT